MGSSYLIKDNNDNRIKQLPIGFRFRPTDEELLVHYLRRKIFSLPLPASVVQDHFDLLHFHPSHLPGDLKEKRYFFSKRNNNEGMKVGVNCWGGYWKLVNGKGIGGRGKVILGNGTNEAVGLKKCFVYYHGKQKTQWIMHQLSLLATIHSTQPQDYTRRLVEMGEWVVCRIYQKKKKLKGGKMVNNQNSFTSNNLSETSYNNIDETTLCSVINLTMMEELDDGHNGPPPQDCSSDEV